MDTYEDNKFVVGMMAASSSRQAVEEEGNAVVGVVHALWMQDSGNQRLRNVETIQACQKTLALR